MSAQIIAFPQSRIVRLFEVVTQVQLEALAVKVAERIQARRAEEDKERLNSLAALIKDSIDKAPPAMKPRRKR